MSGTARRDWVHLKRRQVSKVTGGRRDTGGKHVSCVADTSPHERGGHWRRETRKKRETHKDNTKVERTGLLDCLRTPEANCAELASGVRCLYLCPRPSACSNKNPQALSSDWKQRYAP
ncbi:unnamed protein product [Pleuronectes platessa]|uniref:Uncharacterized protein n=1 Tax=Pleuronectes platessa TaxID=8262 RepID=A0A9N7VUR6_PLEPL|nr:unnamed protein product [Pleuronectes platessa]